MQDDRLQATGACAAQLRSMLGGVVFVCIAFLTHGSAVQPADPAGAADAPIAEPGEPYREKVHLVLLPTSVTNRRGQPVRGLDRDDFVLHEDGVVQPIEFLNVEENLPVSIAFVLDVSGSMGLGGRLDDSKRAIRGFVESLRAEDRFGLICFADDQVAWVTPFTSDRKRFLERLAVQEALGPTALYDALAASPELVDEQAAGRRAIVLLTDGFDNASRLAAAEAVWLARRVKVPIYILDLVPMRAESLTERVRQSLQVLERFTFETGGAVHPVHGPQELGVAVAAIQAELRFQYVLGYRPSIEQWDGTFRRIQLDTRRGGLVVRTRSGFYADP